MTGRDSGFQPQLPTEEELKALLGRSSKDDLGDMFEDDRPVVRFLLASRNDKDLDLLTRALAENRVDMSIARNPFTALDHLRAREFSAIISDFALWTAGGNLLFQRLGQLEYPVDVVFLCDRDPEVVAKARSTPAKAVLERPLNAVLLGGVIEDICRRHRLDVKEGGDFVRAAAVFPQRDTEVLDDNDVVAPAEAGLGGRRLDDLPADEASVGSASELPEAAAPWFRFFFEARRIIRTSDGIEERRERVFRQLMETCGARMVAWMSCGPSPTAAFPGQLEIQSCWSPKRQVSELEPEDWKRVFHVLSRLPEKWYRDRRGDTDSLDSRMSTAVVSAEALVVPVFSRSTSRVRLVLALPHSQESMAQLPDAIAEELPYLLGEVER